jgi:anti-sigma factor RsiW
MSTRPTITEEELHAFIDGELDPSRHDAIARALREDEALAARVARYREDKKRLASVYGPLLKRPMPRSWETQIRQGGVSAPRHRELAVLAAMAASLLLVIGGVWLASDMQAPQTRSLVGEALAARSGDLRPESAIASGVDAHSAGQEISAALAMKAKAPVLARFGYHLAALKSYYAGPRRRTIELVYANTKGRELTLYVSRSVGAPRFDQYESGGLRVCIWQDDVVGMVMAGSLSAAEMQRLATLAYDGLTA